MLKHYPVEGEKVFYLTDEAFTFGLQIFGYPKWKAKLIGGYALSSRKEIYIKESRRGDVKLLNHERGHLRGYQHTWLPTLMFPSWLGRIFNRYNPPYQGAKA